MADKIVKKTGYIFVEDGKEHRASEKTFNDYGGIEAYKADSPNTKVRMQKDGKLYDIPLSRYDEAAEWGYSLYKYEKNDTIKEPDFSEFERQAPDFAEYENKPTKHVQSANLDAPQPGVPVVSESALGIGDEPVESTRVALPTLENLTSGVAPSAPSAEEVNPTTPEVVKDAELEDIKQRHALREQLSGQEQPTVVEPKAMTDAEMAQAIESAKRGADKFATENQRVSDALGNVTLQSLQKGEKPFVGKQWNSALGEFENAYLDEGKVLTEREITHKDAVKPEKVQAVFENAVDRLFAEEQSAAEARANLVDGQNAMGGFTPAYGGMARSLQTTAQKMQETDLEKVMGNVVDKLLSDDALLINSVKPYVENGMSVEDAVKTAANELATTAQQRMMQRYKEQVTPDSKWSYMFGEAWKNSLANQLGVGIARLYAGTSGLGAQIKDEAYAQTGEKAGSLYRVGAGVGTLLLDAPAFGGLGKGAGFVTSKATQALTNLAARKAMGVTTNAGIKAAERYIASGLGARMAQGMATTGLTLGSYDGLAEFARGMRTGADTDVSGRIEHGMLTGALIGWIPIASRYMRKNMSATGKMMTDAGAFVTEAELFNISGLLSSGEAIDIAKHNEGFFESAATLVAMKGSHKLPMLLTAGGRVQMRKELADRYNGQDYINNARFTREEIAELNRLGYDVKDMFKSTDIKKERKKTDIDAEYHDVEVVEREGKTEYDVLDRYQAIQADDRVPMTIKAKMLYFVERKIAVNMPIATRVDYRESEDGFAVETYDAVGRLIARKSFKITQRKEAEALRDEMMLACEGNSISVMEQVYDRQVGEEALAMEVRKTWEQDQASGNPTFKSIQDVYDLYAEHRAQNTPEWQRIVNKPSQINHQRIKQRIESQTGLKIADILAKPMDKRTLEEVAALAEYERELAVVRVKQEPMNDYAETNTRNTNETRNVGTIGELNATSEEIAKSEEVKPEVKEETTPTAETAPSVEENVPTAETTTPTAPVAEVEETTPTAETTPQESKPLTEPAESRRGQEANIEDVIALYANGDAGKAEAMRKSAPEDYEGLIADLEAEREMAIAYANGEPASEKPLEWEYWAEREGLTEPTDNDNETAPIEETAPVAEETKPKLTAMEKARGDAVEARVAEWNDNVGKESVRVVKSIDEVANAYALKQIQAGERVAGWYDTGTNQVVIYAPNIESMKDVDKTYVHEVVGHDGIRALFGSEKDVDAFFDKVYDSMPEAERERLSNYPGVKDIKDEAKKRRAVADEYVAKLAEKEISEMTTEERSAWDKIVEWIRDAVTRILGKTKLTEEDIREAIRASYAKMRAERAGNKVDVKSNPIEDLKSVKAEAEKPTKTTKPATKKDVKQTKLQKEIKSRLESEWDDAPKDIRGMIEDLSWLDKPIDIEDVVYGYLESLGSPKSQYRLLLQGDGVAKGVTDELGLPAKEIQRMVGFNKFATRANGGISLQEMAERIFMDLDKDIPGAVNVSDSDIRNIMIDILHSTKQPSDISTNRANRRMQIAEDFYNDWRRNEDALEAQYAEAELKAEMEAAKVFGPYFVSEQEFDDEAMQGIGKEIELVADKIGLRPSQYRGAEVKVANGAVMIKSEWHSGSGASAFLVQMVADNGTSTPDRYWQAYRDGKPVTELMVDEAVNAQDMEQLFDEQGNLKQPTIEDYLKRKGITFEAKTPIAEGEDYEAIEDGLRFKIVDDEEIIKKFETEPLVKTYRAMVKIGDKYYPPMSTKEDGKLREGNALGDIIQSEERPDLAIEKDGKYYFKLEKDNDDNLEARYNPYLHTSDWMMNDQFKQAGDRPNLVVVEMGLLPSDLESGYHAEKAKDPTGWVAGGWKAGDVANQLPIKRQVALTQYGKMLREVPTQEVAEHIYKLIDGYVDVLPTNMFAPQVRKALENMGMQFVKTDNQGYVLEGENAGKTWASVYGEMTKARNAKKAKKAKKTDDGDMLVEAAKKATKKATKKTKKTAEKVDEGDDVSVEPNGNLRFNVLTFEDWTDSNGVKHEGTMSQVLNRMKGKNFSEKDIADMERKMTEAYAYMKKLEELSDAEGRVRFDKLVEWAKQRPNYKQIGKNYVKAITSLVSNGDYPINLELTTDCIKREAFTHLLNALVRRGADLSAMGPAEIVTIQKMMKQYGIEVACDLCFVEGKRLQIVNWAQQIVDDWNKSLIEAGVNTDEEFGFGQDGEAFIPVEEWESYKDKSAVAKTKRTIDEVLQLFANVNPKDIEKRKRENAKAVEQYKAEKAEKWAKRTGKPASEWKPTKEQKSEIKKLKNEGLAVEYVGKNMNAYKKAFERMRAEWVEKNPGKDVLSFTPTAKQWDELGKIRNKQIGDVQQKMVRLIMEYPEMRKKMTLNDLLGSKGLMDIRQQHGEAYAQLYSIILQRFGTGTPKPVQDAVPYDGEVMTLSEKDYEKANKIGGARLFSFSDFDITKVFDYMQMFFDLEANKQRLQSYTKEIAAPLIFGKSNVKMNISTLAKAIVPDSVKEEYKRASEKIKKALQHKWAENAGLIVDENGKISGINFSKEHSVSPEFAQEIFHDDERNKDCGAIMVGCSVNHAIYSALQDWIRMVIPFHLSGMPLAARDKTDVLWYTDFTEYQSTRKKTSGGWSKISDKEDTFKFYDDMDKEGWNMRDKTREYLAWCEKNGYRPKFDWGINSQKYVEYCEENGYTPNQELIDAMDKDTENGVWNQYYKFLTDFTAYKPVFNEKGEMIDEIPSPQKPIVTDFDMSEVEKEVLFEGENSILAHREDNIKKTNQHIEELADKAERYLAGEVTEEELNLRDDVFYDSSADARKYLDANAGKKLSYDRGTRFRIGEDEEQTNVMNSKQKAVGKEYPAVDEGEFDNLRFRVTNRQKETIMSKKWLGSRTDLSDAEKESFIEWLDKQDYDAATTLATARWFANGTIRVPEDMAKVQQAVKVANIAKVDATQFKSPMEVIDIFADIKPKEKAINPDEVKTLSNKVEYPNGIAVYDVEDSQESRENMRKIINTHFGEDANPWCLLQGDGNGNLIKGSQRMWEYYNKYPKRVAFKNGKLIAFFASRDEPTWWDRQDAPHNTIPYTYKDNGRTIEEGYDETTGESVITKIYKGNKENGVYEEWYPNGQMSSHTEWKDGRPNGAHEQWNESGQKLTHIEWKDGRRNGVSEQWYSNGQIKSHHEYKDGVVNGITELWHENGQKKLHQEYGDKLIQTDMSDEFGFIPGIDDAEYKPVGVWEQWNSEGVKTEQIKFENGQQVGVTRWYDDGTLQSFYGKQNGQDMSITRPNKESKTVVTTYYEGNNNWHEITESNDESSYTTKRRYVNNDLVEEDVTWVEHSYGLDDEGLYHAIPMRKVTRYEDGEIVVHKYTDGKLESVERYPDNNPFRFRVDDEYAPVWNEGESFAEAQSRINRKKHVLEVEIERQERKKALGRDVDEADLAAKKAEFEKLRKDAITLEIGPDAPVRGADEDHDSYSRRMEAYENALNEWRSKRWGEDSILDAMLRDASNAYADMTDEEFKEYIEKEKDRNNLSVKEMKAVIKNQIRERRRYIDVENWRLEEYLHELTNKTTKEQRKQIPFILEGSYAIPVERKDGRYKKYLQDTNKVDVSMELDGKDDLLQNSNNVDNHALTANQHGLRQSDVVEYAVDSGAKIYLTDSQWNALVRMPNGDIYVLDRYGVQYAMYLKPEIWIDPISKDDAELIGMFLRGEAQQVRPQGLREYVEDKEYDKDTLDVARDVRGWYEEAWSLLELEGMTYKKEAIEDYVTHIWDLKASNPTAITTMQKFVAATAPKALKDINNYVATNTPYMRTRAIASLQDGMAIGLVPKFEDITDILRDYGHRMNEGIANRRLVNFVKGLEVNGMPAIREEGSKAGTGLYVPIKNNALRGYEVHTDVKPVLDIIFGEYHTSDNAFWQGVGKTWDMWGGLMKKINLSLSFFHHGALTESAIAMMGLKAFKVVAKNIIWDAAMKGHLPAFNDTKLTADAVKHFVQLGATNDYSAKDVQLITEKLAKWAEGIVGVEQAANFVDFANKGLDKILWDYLHDGLKIYSYGKLADEIRAKAEKQGWDEETLNKALDEAGQLINDTFGGQHWDLLGQSPNALKWYRRLLLSPDWTVSSIRQALAPFGFGQMYNDKSFWKKWFKHDDVASVRKKYGRSFWLTAFIFFGITMNALNAMLRAKDEEEEKKKADEIRKTNPDYKSPYEIVYPEGMKWWDYTMLGNAQGHQTHLFMGRYADGKEGYLRWGKQFRELPELFLGRDGLGFPDPMIDKIVGKLNPMINFMTNIVGGISPTGYENPFMRDKKGTERNLGRLMVLATAHMPYSIPTDEEKEFKLIDLVMPSTKGFSTWKAIDRFKTGIKDGDMDYINKVIKACVMNGVDAEETLNAAMKQVEVELKDAMMEGVENLEDAMNQYDTETNPMRKMQLRNYIRKQLSAQEWKEVDVEALLEDAYAMINGGVSAKDIKKYDELTTLQDVTEDWRIDHALAGLKEYEDQWKEVKESGDTIAQAIFHRDKGAYIEKAKHLRKVKYAVNEMKKKLGKGNDEEVMKELRSIRDEAFNPTRERVPKPMKANKPKPEKSTEAIRAGIYKK